MKVISALLFISVLFSFTGFSADTANKDHHVKIEVKKNGSTVALYAHLADCTEVTITLTMNLDNMTASPPVPLTVDSLGKQEFLLTTIHPTAAKKEHKYNYQFHSKIGRRLQFAPFPFNYYLPYADQEFKVIKGDDGPHNENAINWAMPAGTAVCAARDGVVVAIRQDSDSNGKDDKNKHVANYVVIKHEDNSLAEYSHLQKNSLQVKLGQKVKVNAPLGLSGNTGSPSGPHLHFAVYYNIDGKTSKTIPVQFVTKTGNLTLKTGNSY